MNSVNGATLSHFSFLLFFRIYLLADLEVEMAGYLKELGYGA